MESDEPIALVAQGGGMRGTYSIAALLPFAEAGYTARFGDIYGTSAGAMNGAYYLSGQAAPGLGIYLNYLTTGRFIRKWRVDRIIDIDYLVDQVLTTDVPFDQGALSESRAQLHVGATSATSGDLVWFDEKPGWPVLEVLRASAALPVVFGREIAIGSDRYVDGGLNVPVPVERAIADGYRNIVVVLTRPLSYIAKPPHPAAVRAIKFAARLQGHSSGVLARLGTQGEHINRSLDIIRRAQSEPGDVNIWCIAPSAPIAGRLTTDMGLLNETVAVGRRDGLAVLRS